MKKWKNEKQKPNRKIKEKGKGIRSRTQIIVREASTGVIVGSINEVSTGEHGRRGNKVVRDIRGTRRAVGWQH